LNIVDVRFRFSTDIVDPSTSGNENSGPWSDSLAVTFNMAASDCDQAHSSKRMFCWPEIILVGCFKSHYQLNSNTMKEKILSSYIRTATAVCCLVPFISACNSESAALDPTKENRVIRGTAVGNPNLAAQPQSIDPSSLLGYWYSAPDAKTLEKTGAVDEGAVVARQLEDPTRDDFDWGTYLGYWYSGDDSTDTTDDSGSHNDDDVEEVGNDDDREEDVHDDDPEEEDNIDDLEEDDNDDGPNVNDVDVSTTDDGEEVDPGQQITITVTDGEISSVDYDEDVKGPVDAIIDQTTLVVMGQTVRLSDSTQVGSEQDGSIVEGDFVEVSGMRDADQMIHATFIEEKRSRSDYSVRGMVTDLDQSNRTFKIGDLVVNYRRADFDNFSRSDLKNDDLVEVEDDRQRYESGSYYLRATEVEPGQSDIDPPVVSDPEVVEPEVVDPEVTDPDNPDAVYNDNGALWVEYKSIITRINDRQSRLKLGSTSVRVNKHTTFVDGTRSDLAKNSLVEVKGWLARRGFVRAVEIDFEDN